MIKRILSTWLVLTVTWTTTWAAAPGWTQDSPPGQLSHEEALERLDRFMNLIEELRSHLDRTQFDLEALLERLEYDPEEILRFVRDEIAFQQYPGLLRGGLGTLMNRAGNSLDQAVLVATLLRDAGFEARIATGQLTPEQATRLVDRMFLPPLSPPPVGDLEAIQETLQEATKSFGAATTSALTTRFDSAPISREEGASRYARAKKTTEDFKLRLLKAEITLGNPELSQQLRDEAKDYFWVEYRLRPRANWQSAHPAFGSEPPSPVERLSVIEEQIPPELQHRLRFEVEIEQRLGGRLIRKAVMNAWDRPIANLIGLRMTFANFPSGLNDLADFEDLREAARKSEFLVPILNGAAAPGAQAFDLNGVTVPADMVGPASFGAAAYFKNVGEKTESAAEALTGLGHSKEESEDQPDLQALTGQWLAFTLIAPGGEERTIHRTVLDRTTDAPRSNEDQDSREEDEYIAAVWKLAGTESFMVSPCDYPAAYVLDRTLEQTLGFRQFWKETLDQRAGRTQEPLSEEALQAFRGTPEFALFPTIASGAPRGPELANYLRSPDVIGTWQRLLVGPTESEVEAAVDIIAQGRQAIRRTQNGLQPAIEETMLAGVWATEAEQLLPLDANGTASHLGAPQMLGEAKQARVELQVLLPSDSQVADQLALPQTMKASIKNALAQGYAVITPERATNGVSNAWWRVDPTTGETLGLGPEGRGAHLVAGLAIMALIAMVLPIGVFFISFGVCLATTDCSSSECSTQAGELMFNALLAGLALWFITAAVALLGALSPWGEGIVAVTEAVEAGHHSFDVTHSALTATDCGDSSSD